MFEKKFNILITGAKGQLGSYLVDYFTKKSFLKKSRIGKVFGIDIEDLDISDAEAVADFFNKNVIDPPIDLDYVIHCAAATDTVAIEKDPEKYYAVNCLGPKNIARSCAHNGIKMVFISSDYVLSEKSPIFGANFQEFPVNQYGLQKLIAEQFVKEEFKDKPKDCMVLRSSWMFGNSDHSFVEKFLANVFKTYAASLKDEEQTEQVEVKVVDDAYGRPTPVWFIADTIESLMLTKVHGTLDLQYPLQQISRFDWASMVWKAFVDAPYDHAKYKIVDELKNAIKLVPVTSKQLGVAMHHPGFLGIQSYALIEDNAYEHDTKMYVDKNWLKYTDLAKCVIEENAQQKAN